MPNDNIFSGLKVVDLASFYRRPKRSRDPVGLWRRRRQGRATVPVSYGELRTRSRRSRKPTSPIHGTWQIATSAGSLSI